MKRLDHPGVVRLHGVMQARSRAAATPRPRPRRARLRRHTSGAPAKTSPPNFATNGPLQGADSRWTTTCCRSWLRRTTHGLSRRHRASSVIWLGLPATSLCGSLAWNFVRISARGRKCAGEAKPRTQTPDNVTICSRKGEGGARNPPDYFVWLDGKRENDFRRTILGT